MIFSERVFTKNNINEALKAYTASVEEIGESIQGLKGRRLLEALKRGRIELGPYPDVTLFEAANRIMSDLVIMNGVKWLLDQKVFPFEEYIVELGNENFNDHDIQASNGSDVLIGEAFNVAPSFFQIKKTAMLKKLRNAKTEAKFRIIMVNHDAIKEGYSPKGENGEFYIFVNTRSSSCEIFPRHY